VTKLEAHAKFALLTRDQRAFLDESFATVQDGTDFGPALGTALADLSGWLEDAADREALIVAAKHGASLVSAGLVTDQQMADAMSDVMREVVAWGERQCEGERPCEPFFAS
jgi:hypothetical protein